MCSRKIIRKSIYYVQSCAGENAASACQQPGVPIAHIRCRREGLGVGRKGQALSTKDGGYQSKLHHWC